MDIELAQAALPAAFTPTAAIGDYGADGLPAQHFGLAMRFAVSFSSGDGTVQSLGEWSACKGLRVEFRTETVKRGGEYGYEVKLPVQVAYGPVTLERAMNYRTSQRLQSWLAGLVQTWMDSGGGDGITTAPAGSVTITLLDMHQNVVASWTLNQAFPVSWSGPALDAKGSTVAIESLTLEHQGFLPPVGALPQSADAGL